MGNPVVDLFEVVVELVHPQGRPLADGGQLGRLEVGVGEAGHILILFGESGEVCKDIDDLFADQLEGVPHDDDVGVVADIAGGSARWMMPFAFGHWRP